MKKFYVLLSVMVLALMTAGFSYAYWSDTLTVSATATTGTMDVEFKELSVAGNYVNKNGGQGYYLTDGAADEDLLTINLNNLYPGASWTLTGKVKNIGSIPVVTSGWAIDPSSGLRGDVVEWADELAEAGLEVTFVFGDSSLIEPWSHTLDPQEEIAFTITIEMPYGTEVDNSTQDKEVSGIFYLAYDQGVPTA